MKREEGDLKIINDGQVVQVNVHRVTLPGLFVVFPSTEETKAVAWARALAARTDLVAGTDITNDVPGALAAGVTQSLKLVFGSPEIHHA